MPGGHMGQQEQPLGSGTNPNPIARVARAPFTMPGLAGPGKPEAGETACLGG